MEYASSLLREIQLEAAGREFGGVLYGMRVHGGFRLLSTRMQAGSEPVGIFAVRIRGEVFMTESDLEQLGDRDIALVLAGEKAGFFVREADGSMQSVQSYEEFPAPPAGAPRKRRRLRELVLALACLGLLPAALIPPHRAPPIGLALHAESGQLHIAWNRSGPGSLGIVDGAVRTQIPVSPDLASATYLPRTGDVRIELRRPDGEREEARYIGQVRAEDRIAELKAEASALKKIAELHRSRVIGLEKEISQLSR